MSAISVNMGVAPAKPRSSLKRALIVSRRELRDTLRDWRIVTPIAVLVIVLPLLLATVLSSNRAFLVERIGELVYYDRLLPFTMLAIGFLPMSFCLVIALETFVGEKERNSLEALLTAPLTDYELFMGKYLAAVLPTVFASGVASIIFSGVSTLQGQPVPLPAELWITFVALNCMKAFVMVAASVLVSTHTTSVRAANIMASFIILPMSIAVQIEAILLLNDQENGLYFMLAGLFVILLLLLRSGIRIFNREEIVSREGDNISFKGVFRGFGYFFKRTPREALAHKKIGAKWTIWRLYRHDIPQIIAFNKGAAALLVICMVGAVILGFWVSNWPEISGPSKEILSRQAISGAPNPICQSSAEAVSGGLINWRRIFFNNTFAVIFAGFLSMLTLGLGGIGILMLSVGPIGLIGGLLGEQNVNTLPLLFGFVVPHGLVELPAVVIGFAAGIRVGLSLLAPPTGLTIGQSFQFTMVNFVKLQALLIPVLLIAAIIEANVTPAIGCWLTDGKY